MAAPVANDESSTETPTIQPLALPMRDVGPTRVTLFLKLVFEACDNVFVHDYTTA